MAGKNLGNLFVTLSAKTSEFTKAFSEATQKINAVGEAAEKVRNSAGIAFASIAAGIAIVTKAASEQIEAQNMLALALRNAGESADIATFNDLAGALQSTTTFSDDAALSAATLMVNLGATGAQARAALPAVANLAAAMNIDLGTAARAVGSALAGNSDALARMKIQLSDADKYALEFGSEAQRLGVIMDNLAKFQGAAAEKTKTAAGAFDQAKNASGEIAEAIGMILDKPLSGFFNDVAAAANVFAGWINNLSPEMKSFAATATLVGLGVAGITTAIAAVVAILPTLTASFATAGALISASLLPITAAIGAAVVGVGGMIALLDKINGTDSMAFIADQLYAAQHPALPKAPAAPAADPWDFAGTQPGVAMTMKASRAKASDPTLDFSGDNGMAAITVGTPSTFDGGDEISWLYKDFFEKGAPVYNEVAGAVGMFGQQVQGAMGFAGQLVGDAMKGFEQGGIFGAVGAVVTDLLLQAPAMQQGFQMLNDFLGKIVMALNPLIRAVLPAFAMFLSPLTAIIGVIGELFAKMEPTIQIFAKVFALQFMPYIMIAAKVLEALSPALNSFATLVEKITYTLASIVNGLISMLQGVLRPLSELPFGIGDAFDAVIDMLDDFKLTFDSSYIVADMPDDANGLADAMKNLTETTDAVSESLTNVPQGFKVASARYAAINPGMGAQYGNAAGSARTNIFNSGAITIVNQDPVKIWEKLKRVMEADNFNSTGTTIQTASPFALPSYG